MSLLPPFNSGMPSYFAPPLKGELEKLSPTEIVARTLLSMHRQKSSSASTEIKAASGISEADVAGAVTKIERVFNSSFSKSISPSKTENLALLLLHLEEGAPAKQILDEFNKLKYEDLTFLCDSVSQGDPDKGLQSIKRDPFLLLRVKNGKGENPVESLLERHKCQEIRTNLRALEGKSLDEIKASPYFSLLCNFVRWEDGGKEDPYFKSADYGETTISAKPEALFSGSPSRIDRLCSNLEKCMQSDRDRGVFHEIKALSPSFAKADTDAYAKIAQAMPNGFDFSKLDEIKDEKLRIEIAKRFAAIDGAEIAQDILKFRITDQTALIAIAKIAAVQSGEGNAQYIQNYGITDQAALIDIAMLAVNNLGKMRTCRGMPKGLPKGFSECIKNYGIDPRNQAALIEIAKIVAACNGEEVSEHIQNYGITSQKDLVEIAKIAAAHTRFGLSKYIQNYGITSQANLIEIAKIAAAHCGAGVSNFIQNFRIDPTNQKALVEIAKIAADENNRTVSEYIQNYGITDQKGLIEIAKIAAADGWAVSINIQNYGIDPANQTALIEIAKLAAARSGIGVSEYIQHYGIDPTNQVALIEIAEIAAAHDGYGLSEYIKNYEIDPANQEALIKIAKIAAAQSGEGISRHIKNYRIDPINQAVLVEIAKIAAGHDGWRTSLYIQKYGIDPANQTALIEIAKIAAGRDGWGTSNYLKNFGIDPANQTALIEIAKLAAAQSGKGVSIFLENFGIDPANQTALIEIAKLAAAQSGEYVSIYIQNFGIDPANQTALIEIAKIAAAQSGSGVSEHIKRFGIDPENQEALIEIAKIAAAQSGFGVSEHIQKYGISPGNQTALIEIAKIAAAQIRLGTLMPILTHEIAKHILNFGITSAWEIKNAIEPGCLGVKESLANVSLDATYTAILGYRNPAMKLALATEFLVSLGDEAYRKRYASLLLNKKGETIAHLRLPMVFVAKFMETPESPEGAAIKTKFLEYREKWKDAKSNLLSSALNTLNLLDKNSTLSSKQKLQLLSQVAVISTDAASLKLNLQKMGFLLATHYFLNGSEDLLKQRTSEKFSEDFNEIFIAHIKKQMLEGVSVEPAFIEKYLELSFTQREPFALEQYAARIEEPLVKEEMNRFIFSIVNGEFRAARYSVESNPHLMELASYSKKNEASSLWNRWQNLSSSLPARAGAGAEEDSVVSSGAGAVLVREAKETTAVPSFKDWLYQKLIMDKHLLNLSEKLPHLLAFLNKTKESEELLLSESLKPIERACLLLCSKGSLEEKLGVLKDLKAKVEKDEVLGASEWKNDIEAMLLQLTSKGAEGFKGVITDDWQDLFLCGTEVSGSCQRIDGDLSLNKCLLGYCMDGKVQMIALKDPKSGKLLARAVLKLLLKEETDLTGKKVLKPVVFLERIYANTMSDSYIKAINALAIERAKFLGIELYTWNDFPSSSSEVRDLSSLGSSSPYEYEDGGVGVSKGVYLIHGAKKVG